MLYILDMIILRETILKAGQAKKLDLLKSDIFYFFILFLDSTAQSDPYVPN